MDNDKIKKLDFLLENSSEFTKTYFNLLNFIYFNLDETDSSITKEEYRKMYNHLKFCNECWVSLGYEIEHQKKMIYEGYVSKKHSELIGAKFIFELLREK